MRFMHKSGLITGPERSPVELAPSGSPLRRGRCREFIYQVDNRNAATRVLMSGGRVMTIAELLPEQ